MFSDGCAPTICKMKRNKFKCRESRIIINDNSCTYDMNVIIESELGLESNLPTDFKSSSPCDQPTNLSSLVSFGDGIISVLINTETNVEVSHSPSFFSKMKRHQRKIFTFDDKYSKMPSDKTNSKTHRSLKMPLPNNSEDPKIHCPSSPDSSTATESTDPISPTSSLSSVEDIVVKKVEISPRNVRQSTKFRFFDDDKVAYSDKSIERKTQKKTNRYTNQINKKEIQVDTSYLCYQNARRYMEDRLVIKRLSPPGKTKTDWDTEERAKKWSNAHKIMKNLKNIPELVSLNSPKSLINHKLKFDFSTSFNFSWKNDICEKKTKKKDCLSLFAVFDGHGGDQASQYCCDNFSSYLQDEDSFPQNLSRAMRSTFRKIDKDFIDTSQEDGTTACACILVGRRRIVCANAGDSRAIIVRSDGSTISLSNDHKPGTADELRRITKLGGRVVHAGSWRVEGLLAVSRAIGDARLKPFVTSEPDIAEYILGKCDSYDGRKIWRCQSSQDNGKMLMFIFAIALLNESCNR